MDEIFQQLLYLGYDNMKNANECAEQASRLQQLLLRG